jgi:hypothetical protein
MTGSAKQSRSSTINSNGRDASNFGLLESPQSSGLLAPRATLMARRISQRGGRSRRLESQGDTRVTVAVLRGATYRLSERLMAVLLLKYPNIGVYW